MIIKYTDTRSIADCLKTQKNTALVGGCFDILHYGHIKFLEKVKDKNNFLVILLESDKRVRELKGNSRPIFNQNERAYVLSSLKYVDLVILLPDKMDDTSYTSLVEIIKPTLIGITENDKNLIKKDSQAKKIGAIIKAIPHIDTYSTSSLAKLMGIE